MSSTVYLNLCLHIPQISQTRQVPNRWSSSHHLKYTLPPGFPQSEHDILVVQAKHLCVILNSTLSSSTPTFNEPIRLIDLICKMFLCSVHLFSSHLLHPNLSHCISLLTGLLLQLRLFFNIFLQSKQDFLSF